jgi:hypothetical protein
VAGSCRHCNEHEIPYNVGCFLSGWEAVSLSRTPVHGLI